MAQLKVCIEIRPEEFILEHFCGTRHPLSSKSRQKTNAAFEIARLSHKSHCFMAQIQNTYTKYSLVTKPQHKHTAV